MIAFDLSNHKRARIWIGDLPGRPDSGGVILENVVPATMHTDRVGAQAAIEIWVPTGARALYGMLGAELGIRAGNELHLFAPTVANPFEESEPTLAGTLDRVYIGLSTEYAAAVLRGAVSADAGSKLGPGSLNFCIAKHSAVGSSEHLFERLATFLVDLIASNLSESESASIEQLLSSMAW
jgi:hypothetical protein